MSVGDRAIINVLFAGEPDCQIRKTLSSRPNSLTPSVQTHLAPSMLAAASVRRATGATARLWRSLATSTHRLGADTGVEPARLRTLDEFLDFRRAHPDDCAIIEHAIDEWPLMGPDWGPERLRDDHGDVEVPLEVSTGGADYRDAYREEDTGRTERKFQADHFVRLGDFVDAFVLGGRKLPPGSSAYLAQHDLLARIPTLANACSPTPQHVGDGDDAQRERSMRRCWFGPGGTKTPLHRDPYHNILAQAWGHKRVVCYGPNDTDKMYPFTNNGFLRNTSAIEDVDDVDANRFPLFGNAKRTAAALAPGECLFMPAGTWHEVRATSVSLSVSYWWGRKGTGPAGA